MRFGLRTVMAAMCLAAGGTAVVFQCWAQRLREEREAELANRLRQEREAELTRLSAELRRLVNSAEFDAALALAPKVRRLAEQVGDQEQIRRVAANLDALEKENARVVQMYEQARDLEREEKYKDACQLIEELHLKYPFWKTAREAEFPFAMFVEPKGVRIWRDGETEPRWTSPATGAPIVLRLPFRCARFSLNFEKVGYRPRTLDRLDERVDELRVRLDPR